MTQFDCADVVNCIWHLLKLKKKHLCLFESGAASNVASCGVSCTGAVLILSHCLVIWFSFPNTLCSQGISRGTTHTNSHFESTHRHTQKNVCAGSYLWVFFFTFLRYEWVFLCLNVCVCAVCAGSEAWQAALFSQLCLVKLCSVLPSTTVSKLPDKKLNMCTHTPTQPPTC